MLLPEEQILAFRKAWEAELLADRARGMGWGELAKKYNVANKYNLRRLVKKASD